MPHSVPRSAAAVALLLCIAASNATAHAEAGRAAIDEPIPRDNWVRLRPVAPVERLEFQYAESLVSEGQRIGVQVRHDWRGMWVDVVTPRKGTREVAQDLMLRLNNEAWRMVGAGNRELDPAPAPETLNFWIGGRFWINGVEVPGGLYLAQGNRSMSNNWWAANSLAQYRFQGPDLRLVDAQGGVYCIRPPVDAVNEFWVESCWDYSSQD